MSNKLNELKAILEQRKKEQSEPIGMKKSSRYKDVEDESYVLPTTDLKQQISLHSSGMPLTEAWRLLCRI